MDQLPYDLNGRVALITDANHGIGAAAEALVELGIGNGRVAIPIAQATGQRVIGIDTSPAMLEQARQKAAAAGVELELIQGDMRDLALDEPAALSDVRCWRCACTACRPNAGAWESAVSG